MPKATFVLSLDAELAWGCFDQGPLERYPSLFNRERDTVRHLLRLLDQYRVSATWAFVGHLFLDQCAREQGSTHPDVLRPSYPWYSKDWHGCDPGTDVHRDPWWYAPDIVDMVLAAHVPHDIGTHTFSHVIAGDPACTADVLRSQLRACKRLHDQRGVPLKSVVFPRNRVGHLDVLRELGIVAYRGPEANWYHHQPEGLRPVLHIVDRLAAACPPIYPLDGLAVDGLCNVPASMYLLSLDGIRRAVPLARRWIQAGRGLRRAVERGELFHLWFHPHNLASGPGMFVALERILSHVVELEAAGTLEVLTMAGVAERVVGGG
jgi:peptidoglycan/xylan/chitin deacetylase (PgdA/CDA1 family)